MKGKQLLWIGIVLMLLVGCTNRNPAPTLPPTDPPQDTTVPSTAVTLPEETEPVLAAVNPLSVLEVPADGTVLDHRTVAFLSTNKDTEEPVTCVRILDLYTDTILAQKEFSGTLEGPVQNYCPGFLPLFNRADGTCTVFDSTLEPVLQFQPPNWGGVFTENLNTYYYISAQRLYRMDIASGASARIIPDQALPLESIVDYDAGSGQILVNVHTQYYLTKLCPGVIEPSSGRFALLSTKAQNAGFLANGIAVTALQENSDPAELYLLDQAGDGVQLLQNVMRNDMGTSSVHINGSNFLVSLHYYASSVRGAYRGCTLYRLTERCESTDLGKLMGLQDLQNVLALPDGNLLCLLYSRQSTTPVLICTDQLVFSPAEDFTAGEFTPVDIKLEQSYALQSREVSVSEQLSEVRARADALEEKYSITILISNQCKAPLKNCDAYLITTDQARMENEALAINSALDELEEAFELYPYNFFGQFRNEANERGILVLLVQDIHTGFLSRGYDILGISFQMDDWYPIAVDITTENMTSTFCHELWHATENKINEENPTLLSDVTWYKYNPRHFVYSNNTAGDWASDSKDTFLGGYGSQSYFVDGYGKTNAYEDRARLMEYVMTSDYYSYEMMKAPGLRQKMQVMSDAIRAVFDTSRWYTVHWERDLVS